MNTAFSAENDQIAPALVAFQAEVTDPVKNTSGYGYKYATLDQILNIARPLLSKHGLAMVQMATTRDQKCQLVEVTTRLIHTSGQWIEATLGMWVGESKGMSAAQATGSVITYARRYAVQTLLGMAAEEDTDAAPVKTTMADTEDF